MTDDITLSKTNADGRKYFSLFDKYIPANLTKSSTVLLYSISNVDCIANIIEKNPSCTYYIYDSEDICDAVCCFVESASIYYVKDFEYITENDMKFDCIIMNPPYQRNLHLNILAETIKHLKDSDSVCINLSPCEWLIDTLNEVKKNSAYNKYKSTILNHLNDFELIDAVTCNKLFNVGLMSDLAIYKCKKDSNVIDSSQIKWLKTDKHMFNKLIDTTKKQFPDVVKYDEKIHKYFVPLKLIANPYRTTAFNICTSTFKWIVDGKLSNGNHWKTGIYKSKSMNESKQLYGLVFNDENSAKNFYNSTYTMCFKYANMLVKRFNQHVNVTFLPWLGNSINPRTSLKGYESEWTNEDFYTFFNITPDEQKIIEEMMAKYK